VTPEDIHILAGSALTGEILCYCTLRALAGAPAGATMRTRARPLFPVEQTHGLGLYNHLRLLPDLPVRRVRELGRFARNQLASRVSATAARAPVEVGLAVMRLLSPRPDGDIAAAIGDIEEHVAKANLDFLHCPSVIVRGTSPHEPSDSMHARRLRGHTFVPFAFLCADLAASQGRLKAIDDALALPDERALRTLFALKRTAGATASRLVPSAGAASA
jgi:hypothetical protein